MASTRPTPYALVESGGVFGETGGRGPLDSAARAWVTLSEGFFSSIRARRAATIGEAMLVPLSSWNRIPQRHHGHWKSWVACRLIAELMSLPGAAISGLGAIGPSGGSEKSRNGPREEKAVMDWAGRNWKVSG